MAVTSDRGEEHWKLKYLDKLDQIDKKEKEWASIESALRRTIGRLNVAAKGYNKTVDQYLEAIGIAIKDDIKPHRLDILINDLSIALTKVSSDQIIVPILKKLVVDLELPKNCEKKRTNLLRRMAREKDDAVESIVDDIVTLLKKAVVREKHGLLGRLLPASPSPDAAVSPTDVYNKNRAITEILADLNRHIHWPENKRKRVIKIEKELKRDPKNTDALITEYALLINSLANRDKPTAPIKKPNPDELFEGLPRKPGQNDDLETKTHDRDISGDNTRPEIQQVLIGLLEQLAIPGFLNQEVADMKSRLENEACPSDLGQLLKDFASLIHSIRGRLQQEKHEIELFLQLISSRLKELDQYLKSESSSISIAEKEGLEFDFRFESHVDDIRDDINQAVDLDVLKENIETHLNTIFLHIRDYRESEQQRYKIAKNDVLELQKQMVTMEQQTDNLRRTIARKNREAMIDVLTELPNRQAYEKKVEAEIARWKRFHDPLCLAICDIDNFKTVNDSYGHKAGDKALRTIGSVMSARLRETDFLARIGGEEFVVLLPGTKEEDALKPLDELREAVATCDFHYRDKAVDVTLSFGLSAFRDGDTLSDVFDRADKALYRAKENGRNQVQLAE